MPGLDWEAVLKDRNHLRRQLADYLATVTVVGGAGGVEGGAPTTDQEKQLVAQLCQMITDGVADDCSVCLDHYQTSR